MLIWNLKPLSDLKSEQQKKDVTKLSTNGKNLSSTKHRKLQTDK